MGKKRVKRLLVSFDPSMEGNLKAGWCDGFEDLSWKTDYAVINLCYLMSCGDISNVPSSNADIYERQFYINIGKAKRANDRAIKRLHTYESGCEIDLFVTQEREGQILNLCYFIEEFRGILGVHLNYYREEYREGRGGVRFPWVVVEKRVELSDSLISELSEKWRSLSQDGAAVRAIMHGEVVGYSLQEAKAYVLSVFTHEYERLFVLYARFIDNSERYGKWGFTAFLHIVLALFDEGRLERVLDEGVDEYYRNLESEELYRLSGE